MILFDVLAELETRLKTITGLRVYPWATAKITPPGAVIALPDRLVPRGAGRGLDQLEGLTVVVMVGRSNDRAAVKQLSPYVSSSGAKSITSVLEGGTYTTFDAVEVDSIDFEFPELAGVAYLGAMINLNITGQGGTP